jgi:hypothetical protein
MGMAGIGLAIIVLMALPFYCTFLSGLELIFSIFAILIGALVFVAGHIMVVRSRRREQAAN